MIKTIKNRLFGRSVQEIFNEVIECGYYTENRLSDFHPYMCGSILDAYNHNIISKTERKKALAAIREYMKFGSSGYLAICLKDYGLPYSFKDRLHLYKNWKDRPKLGW